LDDLGLSSLDQLPLLNNTDGQAAILASLNSPQEDSPQVPLSLDEVVNPETTDSSEGKTHE
jgi:hypothetical protein